MPTKKTATKKVAKKAAKKPVKKTAKTVKKAAKKVAAKKPAKKVASKKVVAVKPVTIAGVVTMTSVDDPGVATEGDTATVSPVVDKETGVLTMVPDTK